MITHIAKLHETSLDILFRDVEFALISNELLKQRIRKIETALQEQGIKLDNLENNEGLEWISNYFKHAEETSLD